MKHNLQVSLKKWFWKLYINYLFIFDKFLTFFFEKSYILQNYKVIIKAEGKVSYFILSNNLLFF